MAEVRRFPSSMPSPHLVHQMVVYGLSDRGLRRENNEDHFMVADLTRKVVGVLDNQLKTDLFHHDVGHCGTLLMVADGLGGHEGGEIASEMAVDTIAKVLMDTAEQGLPLTEQILRAVEIAHTTICQFHGTSGRTRHMASTLTAMHVGSGTVTLAQVGDSRAYRFRNGQLTMLTEDQTIVRMMQKKGLLTPEEAQKHPHRNIILQALGQDKTVLPEIRSLPYKHNDCFLLCSDGLSSYVAHERITEIMASSADEHLCCRQLIAAANEAGGADNVTVLLARVLIQERVPSPKVPRVAPPSSASRTTQRMQRSPEPPQRRPTQEVGVPPAPDTVASPDAPPPPLPRPRSFRLPWLGKAAPPPVDLPAVVDTEPENKASRWKRDLRWPWGQKAESPPSASSPPPPPAPRTPSGGATRLVPPRNLGAGTAVWEPQVLKVLEEHLASYLGPVAKLLVSREASRTRDVRALCQALAAQLATEQERTAFLRSVLQHSALRTRSS